MSDNTPASFSPPPAPTSPGESVAAPAEVGQVGGAYHDQTLLIKFQDYLISQKQALSSIPAMAEKVLSIDSALHELDLFLLSEGLI